MEATTVPDHLRDVEGYEVFLIGPPPGVAEEDCGSIEGRTGFIQGGVFDGARHIKVYWKPREEELKLLNEGKPIEIEFITDQLIPHSVAVVL